MSNAVHGGPLYTIALSSCQYPGDILRQHAAYRSLATLAITAARALQPTVLLIAGDSIYADATAGLFDPVDPRERYDQAYDTYQRALHDTAAAETLGPQCYSIDDHELIDNWGPTADGTGELPNRESLRPAILAFARRQQGRTVPDGKALPRLWGEAPTVGDHSVFVMDTRTERGIRSPASPGCAQLIGSEQRDALIEWLRQQSATDRIGSVTPKLIMSGSMPLPRRRIVARSPDPIVAAIRSDAWDGYPRTLHEVLRFIAEHQIGGVIFLSGDEHIPCVSDIVVSAPDAPAVRVLSLHAAPLYAPLPFANARVEDFSGNETFSSSGERSDDTIAVQVRSEFPVIGSGFVSIDVPRAWTPGALRVEFRGDRGKATVFR